MTQKAKKKIPFRNKSPYGWWIASYLVRFEFDDEKKENLSRRCLAWENTIIIKAGNREHAFRKAERAGKLHDGMEGYTEVGPRKKRRIGHWRYEGLTSLLPIYEELEDGSELIWNEHQDVTVKKVKSWVKPKEKLETFEDDDDS